MKERIYGVVGISSIMANFNADFSGHPKTNSDGEVFGSDKALKYPMKKMWEEKGEKVLYIKSFKFEDTKDGVKLIPKTLGERYEELFGAAVAKVNKDKSKGSAEEVLKNLFQAIDVKNFGATFAEKGNNIAIAGAVQFGQGFNKYTGHSSFDQPILSPFRDPNAKEKSKDDKEAMSSTLGSKILSNEAHYFYSFNINPKAYNGYVALGVTEGYTREDYSKLKGVMLSSTTSFSTNSKAGCDNEFALLVETEDDLYLPNLADYVKFEKGKEDGAKNKIVVECSTLLNQVKDRVKSVEIYFNPLTTVLEQSIDGARLFDIISQKGIE